MRHRILFQTNPIHLRTGLAENARTLLKYLYKRGTVDLAHLCTQATMANDPKLNLTPWRSYGSIPIDQEVVNRINSDPVYGRDASYGAVAIAPVVEDWKPTIWIGSDDVWSFPLAQHSDAAWYKRVHGLHHITVDSVPILDQAYEQAKRSKHYFTWAKFAAAEMRRQGGASMAHVGSIYGAMDTDAFSPIPEAEKAELRKQFNIPADTFVFLFLGRNQLRKSMNAVLEAFSRFKAEHPGVKAAVHFHTSFSEKGMGWDLPKMAAFYGVKPEELLCTYVCKHCGAWLIAPYQGEDLNCPSCGTARSLVTSNIVNGVPGHHMRLVYGFSDACVSAFTSGGQEYHNVQSLLCGKPLASTAYSCGEDFCIPGVTDTFVTPLKWHPYHEVGTNFVKAATDVGSIAAYMRRMVRSSKRDLQEAGERGRAWAVQTFGIETIGKQWEDLFATLPLNPEWSSVAVGAAPAQRKNPEYQPPEGLPDIAWLKDIYRGILLMEVADNDSGLFHWTDKLKAGVTRAQIIAYFRQVANDENSKAGFTGPGAAPAADLWSLLDKTTGRKRVLFVMKESLGDCLMATQLFEDLMTRVYPNHDLYVMTDPKHNAVFAGNPYVFRLLPYLHALENELAAIGAAQTEGYFHVFLHPGILSQRQLFYLSSKA